MSLCNVPKLNPVHVSMDMICYGQSELAERSTPGLNSVQAYTALFCRVSSQVN